ncbi:D-2-hydroxyacid dehydrogenase [Paenibacillus sp. 1P07SE]|uniref:D-2-hydroxyacid dehydrogenase n=1 Tax=Paenibacillus sp. 1P07SE TaxID=3132209 RepID=UPI0039A4F40D
MKKLESVLVTLEHEEEYIQMIKDALHPATVIQAHRKDAGAIKAALEVVDAAILTGDLDERFLQAPNLRWVHCDHAGLEKSAWPELFEKGIIVTSSAGRSAPALAEHVVFFMLALCYRFADFLDAQRAHQWGVKDSEELRSLYGRTVGIIGLGNIGTELAVRAKAMGMQVLGYRRSQAPLPPGVDRCYYEDEGGGLHALLTESDFVVIAVPLTDTTYHLIGREELAMMKNTAHVINIARGSVIDEDALIEALYARTIAGAGVDTVAQEPLAPESRLWDAPNTFITPHMTPQVPDRTLRSINIMIDNIKRYQKEEPMINQLTEREVFTVLRKDR